MKIVIISPFQFKMLRGIERYVYAISNELSNLDVQVVLYTWNERQNTNWGKWHPNINVRKVPFIKYYRGIWASIFYNVWLRMDRPDVTILNFLYHGEQRLPSGMSYKYILHSPASQIPHRYRYIQSKLNSFKNLSFIAVSKFVKEEAKEYFPNKVINVIYNGVDTSLFRPRPRDITDMRDNRIKLITTAALEERKGIQFVIEAIGKSKRRDIEYHVYGNGSDEQIKVLNDLITKYQLEKQVILHPAINDVNNILPNYDIYCLLSKGEAFGLGWLEALACGLPVIVSKHPPYPELIQCTFGIQVDENDDERIIQAIDEMKTLKNKSPMALFTESASKFGWKKVAEHYIRLFISEVEQ